MKAISPLKADGGFQRTRILVELSVTTIGDEAGRQRVTKLIRMSTRVTWRPRVDKGFLTTRIHVAPFGMSNGDEAGKSGVMKPSGP